MSEPFTPEQFAAIRQIVREELDRFVQSLTLRLGPLTEAPGRNVADEGKQGMPTSTTDE